MTGWDVPDTDDLPALPTSLEADKGQLFRAGFPVDRTPDWWFDDW